MLDIIDNPNREFTFATPSPVGAHAVADASEATAIRVRLGSSYSTCGPSRRDLRLVRDPPLLEREGVLLRLGIAALLQRLDLLDQAHVCGQLGGHLADFWGEVRVCVGLAADRGEDSKS